MKAPPQPRFAPWDFLTPEDLAKGSALQAELSRLRRSVQEYSPSAWRERQRAAKTEMLSAPSAATMETYQTAVAKGDPASWRAYYAFLNLRQAQRQLLWNFHSAEIVPFLRDLYARALARVSGEMAAAAARQNELNAAVEECRAWFCFWGCAFNVPSIQEALADQHAALTLAMSAATRGREGGPSSSSEPPNIPSRFLASEMTVAAAVAPPKTAAESGPRLCAG